MVKTDYYVAGKCVWRQESPDILRREELDETLAYLLDMGFGVVEAVLIDIGGGRSGAQNTALSERDN